MAPANPTTVVFVPGAWHSPQGFGIVAYLLLKAGYNTSLVSLASVGPETHLKDWSQDVDKIRRHIKAAVNKGHHVIVWVHSYGSLPACEAVKGLELKDGKGVSHIFYCRAFVIPEGKSLIQAFGGHDLPWFEISEDKSEVNPSTPANIFYNDMSEDEQQAAVATLRPQSYQCFHSPVTYAAWKHVPSTYLYCLQDQAIPIQVQKLMVEDWAKDIAIRTETVDASHSPFLSQPDAVASAVRRAAGEKL